MVRKLKVQWRTAIVCLLILALVGGTGAVGYAAVQDEMAAANSDKE
ncbi:MAG: hypothetical protein STSR0004_00530 [Peptococcaceae bacterium]